MWRKQFFKVLWQQEVELQFPVLFCAQHYRIKSPTRFRAKYRSGFMYEEMCVGGLIIGDAWKIVSSFHELTRWFFFDWTSIEKKEKNFHISFRWLCEFCTVIFLLTYRMFSLRGVWDSIWCELKVTQHFYLSCQLGNFFDCLLSRMKRLLWTKHSKVTGNWAEAKFPISQIPIKTATSPSITHRTTTSSHTGDLINFVELFFISFIRSQFNDWG